MTEECIHIEDLRFHLKFNRLLIHSSYEKPLIVECQKCESIGELKPFDWDEVNAMKAANGCGDH